MWTIEGHQYYVVLATEGLPVGANKSERFNLKVSGRMRSNAFKRGLGFPLKLSYEIKCSTRGPKQRNFAYEISRFPRDFQISMRFPDFLEIPKFP